MKCELCAKSFNWSPSNKIKKYKESTVPKNCGRCRSKAKRDRKAQS